MSVLFVQKRTHRAGAQTCLARLLRHPDMRAWAPALVCSQPGWLTQDCERHGTPVFVERFPSSRSLGARLAGNASFARRVARQLAARNLRPAIIHANDHLEGLLALELAKCLDAKRAIFLRSPGMTRDDYFKYRCPDFDLIIAVGDELCRRARGWDPQRDIRLIHDGIESSEFAEPKAKAAGFPRRILVIGSPLDWKGWADLTEAAWLLERENALDGVQFDFTGGAPDPARNDLKLARLQRVRCNFLGRVEDFRDLVRGYNLVINPTRMESFGMAAVETVAAGVPLLSSRTGIIEQVIEQPEFLFPPNQPSQLAAALRNLSANWPRLRFDHARAHSNIRARFLVDNAVTRITECYRELGRAAGAEG